MGSGVRLRTTAAGVGSQTSNYCGGGGQSDFDPHDRVTLLYSSRYSKFIVGKRESFRTDYREDLCIENCTCAVWDGPSPKCAAWDVDLNQTTEREV